MSESLEKWKAEFYPEHAGLVKRADALAHSLKKWAGLRKDALSRYGLRADGFGDVVSEDGGVFQVDAHTCALCAVFYDEADDEAPCMTCPLCIARGNVQCDNPRDDEEASPYRVWQDSADPEPMIYWLVKASEQVQTQPTKTPRRSKRQDHD